jgi:signal transduction histidine kinase
MKNLPAILILLVQTGNVFAQHGALDTLQNRAKASVDDSVVMQAYMQLAESLELKSFDSNLLFARKGLAIAIKKNDAVKTGVFYNDIGLAHYFKGAFDSAAVYFFKAINILQPAGALTKLGLTYNNLARLYRKTGAYPRALNFYNKAIAIFQDLKDDDNLASIYNECGVVYEYQKKYDDALLYYNRSLELKKKIKDSVGIAYALSFIAGIYNDKQRYRDAESYALQSLNIRQRNKDSFTIALSYSDLGDIYQAEGIYDKAEQDYTASNSYALGMHYPDMISSNLQSLSAVAYKKKDYKKAFEYYRQYTDIKDSLYKLESARQVEELSAKYETVEKEQTIQQQKFQISRRNYLIAGISGLLLFGSLLGYSFYRRYRLKQQTKLQAEIVRQQGMATKAVISAEENERRRIALELHDGVGQMMSAARMNLSSIENEITFNSPEQKNRFNTVVSLIDDSCGEVRTVSHNMMPNALLKAGLAMAVREFIDKIDKNIIHINLHAEGLNEKIDLHVETVLYRVIQECVNNVIKHARAARLDISLILDNAGISATIEDNGKGFDTSNKNNFEGIGLKNIQSRITYLKGVVEWDSAPGKGTLVAIYVPLL